MLDRFLTPVFVISMTAIVGYYCLAYAILFWHPLASTEVMTSILTTVQNAGFVVAVAYWIGSSSGSAAKDKSKDDLAQKALEKDKS